VVAVAWSVQLANAVLEASAKKLTAPVGVVIGAPTTTLLTVAVQVVGWLT